jgi:O-antigen/teichoic acid export membrane protein
MACTGSGVQIPSAPQTNMNLKYIREIFNQTKDLIGSQSGIAIISIIQVPYVVKQLGPSKYGAVVILIAVASLIFRATHSNNSDAHLLALKEGRSFSIESLFFNLLTGLISFFICILFFSNSIILNSSIGDYFSAEILTSSLILYLCSRVVQTFSETAKALLIYKNELRKYSFLEFSTVCVRFFAIIIFLFSNPSVENYLIAQSIYGFTYGILGIFLVYKYEKIINFNVVNLKEYFELIKPSYKKIRYDQIIGLVPQHFDVILLGIIIDIQAVGIYQFAKRLVEPINYLVVTFNPWLQSQLKTKPNEFKINTFFKQILVPIFIFLGLMYSIFGDKLILIFANTDFLNSYRPMLILFMGFSTYLLTFWIRQLLLFNDLIEYHAYGRIIYSLVFLVLAIFLGKAYSASGIATALSIAMILQKAFEYLIYRKKIK